MSAPARVTLQLCRALTGEEFNGGALDSRVQPMETETGDVVELPDYPLSHRVVGRARMVSDIGSGKPLQHLHRQRITESLIQVIPVIQQRPLFSREQRQAKIDGGGVQRVDRVGDIQARVLVDVKAPCRMDETLSEIGVEAPVPGLIGVGQGVA